MSTQHQRQIAKYFPKKPIAYNPGLSLVFGSVNTGVLLSQLLYWHQLGKDKDGWVYKTIEDLHKETGLTRKQQMTAIRIAVDAGVLKVKYARIPRTRHFLLNYKLLREVLPSMKQKAQIVYPNPPYQSSQNGTTITKTTQETTTKNTRYEVKKAINSGNLTHISSVIGHRRHSFIDKREENV